MDVHIMIEPHNGATYDDQLLIAQTVQQAGFAGLFRADHYLSGVPGSGVGLTDTWTTLAGLARETSRITLGSLVTSATFRRPGPLAVIAAQVDVMSGGRVELGLGAGWWAAEHRAMGIDFPPTPERFDRLQDQLEIVTRLWAAEPTEQVTYRGTYLGVDGAAGVTTVRPGGPPIIIGGSGPRRTPALAARFAREFNFGWETPAITRAQFERVAAACVAIGRDPATLRTSTVQTLCVGRTTAEAAQRAARSGLDPTSIRTDPAGVSGSVADAVDRIGRYAEAGVQRLYLELLDLGDREQLELVATEILPQLA